MQLALSTWQDVETYLQSNTGIIIPIGSMEQHGPTGLIGTDAICPEVIAQRMGDETGTLIGPTFNVGNAQHHLGFPGSMTLRPSTMIAAIVDWTESLQRHGFRRIYWLNGHGGNISTIQTAFTEVYAQRSLEPIPPRRPTVNLKLRNWWELDGIMEQCKQLYPIGEGSHATPSEVAVTYAAYPDQVREVELEPKIAPVGEFTDAEDYRQTFPDGRIGSDPSQATIADGELLITLAAQAVANDYKTFMAS